jgi:Ran GTPase-activating protein (RanGAP) involved in mRNA processing and transport
MQPQQTCNKLAISKDSLSVKHIEGKPYVDMVKQNLDAGDGAILGAMLQLNTEVKVLNLSDNYLGEDGAKEIFLALQQNSALDEVDISMNRIGDDQGESRGGPDHSKSLTSVLQESLSKNDGLVKLNLSGNFEPSTRSR